MDLLVKWQFIHLFMVIHITITLSFLITLLTNLTGFIAYKIVDKTMDSNCEKPFPYWNIGNTILSLVLSMVYMIVWIYDRCIKNDYTIIQ